MNQNFERLSQREKEILELVCSGLENQTIANKLYLSRHTVKSHLDRIYEKLGLRNGEGYCMRVLLAVESLRNGWFHKNSTV